MEKPSSNASDKPYRAASADSLFLSSPSQRILPPLHILSRRLRVHSHSTLPLSTGNNVVVSDAQREGEGYVLAQLAQFLAYPHHDFVSQLAAHIDIGVVQLADPVHVKDAS